MADTMTLQIAVGADTAAAVADFGKVGTAAADMGRDVDKAASVASGGMDRVAGGAENMDDKASKATGALGALSAGFELAGMEEYAAGLQGAAMATDFFSGVGQAASLIMETQWVMRVKDTAATIAHSVASGVATAATAAQTAAQWALNAALNANPIGLIIIAIVALVAIFVVLYKKNEAFRALVQTVFKAVKTYIEAAVAVVKALAGWVTGTLIPAFVRLKDAAVAVWSKITDAVASARQAVTERIESLRQAVVSKFEALREKGREIWDSISDKVTTVKGLVDSAITTLKDAVVGYFTAMFAPIETAIGKVRELIDWVKKIDFPDIPFVGGSGDLRAGGALAVPSGYTPPTYVGGPLSSAPVQVSVTGYVGSEATLAREIEAALDRRAARMGRT